MPVTNLRSFFGLTTTAEDPTDQKLIICHTSSKTVALEVDKIVTIYKQEQYQKTSSLHFDLANKADVLDKLIVFEAGEGRGEHVLVVNIHNFINNYLSNSSN